MIKYRRVHAQESMRLYPRARGCLDFFGQGSMCMSMFKLFAFNKDHTNGPCHVTYPFFPSVKNCFQEKKKSQSPCKVCEHVTRVGPFFCFTTWYCELEHSVISNLGLYLPRVTCTAVDLAAHGALLHVRV